ncbi:MAG: arginase family protein [Bacteroidales bacterium]
MELGLYFDNTSVLDAVGKSPKLTFGKSVEIVVGEDIPIDVDLVIMGVPEDRNSTVRGSASSPDKVREELYRLSAVNGLKVVDLGNFRVGNKIEDSYVALSEIVNYLYAYEMPIVMLGGSQDLILAVLDGINKAKKQVKFVNVDSKLDVCDGKISKINTDNFLSKAYKEKEISISNIAYQKQFCISKKDYTKNRADNVSLGGLRDDFMQDAEPIVREADVVGIDIGVLKAADFPAVEKPNANGLTSEELCKLMVFAGVSYNVMCVGLFNYIPKYDTRNISAFALAQAVWYFCDSFLYRVSEHPMYKDDLFKKYIVAIKDVDVIATFYQSEITGRFWVDICSDDQSVSPDDCRFVPCTDFDFEEANEGKMSSRLFQLLMGDSE